MAAAAESSLGANFFRAMVRGTVAVAPTLVAGPAGTFLSAALMELTDSIAKSGYAWLVGLIDPQPDAPTTIQQEAVAQLAQLSRAQAEGIARDELEAVQLDGRVRELLTAHFASIPMTTQNAMLVNGHAGAARVTTRLAQLPRAPEDLARFLPIRPPHFAPGDRVTGSDLVLLRLLGQGGFGEVWLAENPNTNSQVALKFCLEQSGLPVLRNELELVRGLTQHPHIVQLRDTCLSADPPFLVYEYVDGGDLDAWLARFDRTRPPEIEILRIARMIARGLAHAHARGVVHRDVKPANILVTNDGLAKLSDFGIGRAAQLAQLNHSDALNQRATLLRGACTPLYSDPSNAAGPAYDVFSVGVILYQLALADFTLQIGPDWHSELEEKKVSEGVIRLIGACLRAPARRLADGAQLLASVEEVIAAAATPPVAPAAGTRTDKEQASRRTPPRRLPGAGLGLVLGLGLGLFMLYAKKPDASRGLALVPGVFLLIAGSIAGIRLVHLAWAISLGFLAGFAMYVGEDKPAELRVFDAVVFGMPIGCIVGATLSTLIKRLERRYLRSMRSG